MKTEPNRTEFEKSKPTQPYLWLLTVFRFGCMPSLNISCSVSTAVQMKGCGRKELKEGERGQNP